MTITPAFFKKFIAGTSDVVPCTFDPTDGNAIIWLNNTPCVFSDKIEFYTSSNNGFGADCSATFEGPSVTLDLATGDHVGTPVTSGGYEFEKYVRSPGQVGVRARIPFWSLSPSGAQVYKIYITTSFSSGISRELAARVLGASTNFGTKSFTISAGTPGTGSTDLRATLTMQDTGSGAMT